MRGAYGIPVLCIVAAVLFTPAAGAANGARLTSAEQKWAAPLIAIWNVQNQSLKVVVAQATAKNALIAGEKPQNLALTDTLAALIACKVPADRIKGAGAPPTPRLAGFRNALNAACIHDQNGANDFAKAIGAIGKGKSAAAKSLLRTGYGEFERGTAQLAKAYNALQALGGTSGFKA
jgi:hypothetical protein